MKVERVEILAQNQGADINDILVTIGDNVCGTTPSSVTNGEWLTVTCEDGAVGDSIKLERTSAGFMNACGIKVYGQRDKDSWIEELQDEVLALEQEVDDLWDEKEEGGNDVDLYELCGFVIFELGFFCSV